MAVPTPESEIVPHHEETVLALDNVPLALPVAGPGTRTLAAFLDYLIVSILAALWAAGGLWFVTISRRGSAWAVAVLVLGFFVIEYGYFAGVEVGTGGRTFGKWAMSLRVTSRLGAQAGTPSLLIRNCVRSVDLLTGIPMMALDPLARRLGDRLAGTLVLRERKAEAESLLGRVPRGWDGRQIAIAEDFLRRASELEPDRAERLASQVLGAIEEVDSGLLSGVDRSAGPVETLRRALDFRRR
jgi:uncharacterized RDD family membrane protein YckC